MWNTTRSLPDPDAAPITGDMTLAAVLAAVPGAARIFQEHGVDPVAYCGPTVQIICLDETPAHCKLEDLEGLLVKLNTAARAAQMEASR
jgi:hypothetical protein